MTITIDLPRELEARLSAGAQAQGVPLESYIRTVLDQTTSSPLPEPKRLSAEVLHAALKQMAQFAPKIPPMPGETFRREMIYQDHD